MGTSTGDIHQEPEQANERPESGPGELVVSADNNTTEGAETTASALPTGKKKTLLLLLFFSKKYCKSM